MKQQKRLLGLLGAIVFFLGLILQVLPQHMVSAATQITDRSLTLEAGTVGGSAPSDGNAAHTVKHLFSFTLSDTTDAVGSIRFQYCTTAAPVPSGVGCDAPTGMSTLNATLTSENGVTGFTTVAPSSLDDPSDGNNNVVTLERGSASTIGASPVAVTYELSGMINPSTANQTFFVRISTFTSTTGSGSALEAGAVAASTTNQIVLSGTMPESLVFCTGETIGLTAGVPDCTTATAGSVSFNQLFSPTDTAIAESQMSASTNAGQGYAISVNGATMTSGSNTITAMGSTATTSQKGVSQFGLNLRLNTSASAASFPGTVSPFISADISAASNGTNYRGEPINGYSTPDSFAFTSGDVVADSGESGGSPVASDAQIYTSSYIVNVPGSQPAGTYTTTLTYICTPTF